MLSDVIRRAASAGAIIEKVSVHSGTMNTNVGSVVINLPSTFDPTKSFCILETAVDANVQTYGMDWIARADLENSGNSVTIYRSANSMVCRYSLIVVSLKNARVQKIISTIDNTSATHNITIPLPLESITKAFVFYSFTCGTIDLGRIFHPSGFTNTTTLALVRTSAFSGSATYIFYIVELT